MTKKNKSNRKTTTIEIDIDVKDRLKKLGNKGMRYNDIIVELMNIKAKQNEATSWTIQPISLKLVI